MPENDTTANQQLTPEHMRALVKLAVASDDDDDMSAKSLAALINAVASISDAGARDELAISITEQAYKFTDEYKGAVMSFAQRDAYGHRLSQ